MTKQRTGADYFRSCCSLQSRHKPSSQARILPGIGTMGLPGKLSVHGGVEKH
jgi:hypothetical protein